MLATLPKTLPMRVAPRPCRLPKAKRASPVVAKAQAKPMSNGAKIAGSAALANVLLAGAGHAEGALFDFNLTLPIMISQFLALTVALDNLWFKPVGAILDERDEKIRSRLSGVKDNGSDIARMEAEAAATLKEAQVQVANLIAEAKAKAQEECDKKLAEEKAKVDRQLESSIAELEKEKADTLNNLDDAVSTLSKEIVEKVLA